MQNLDVFFKKKEAQVTKILQETSKHEIPGKYQSLALFSFQQISGILFNVRFLRIHLYQSLSIICNASPSPLSSPSCSATIISSLVLMWEKGFYLF